MSVWGWAFFALLCVAAVVALLGNLAALKERDEIVERLRRLEDR